MKQLSQNPILSIWLRLNPSKISDDNPERLTILIKNLPARDKLGNVKISKHPNLNYDLLVEVEVTGDGNIKEIAEIIERNFRDIKLHTVFYCEVVIRLPLSRKVEFNHGGYKVVAYPAKDSNHHFKNVRELLSCTLLEVANHVNPVKGGVLGLLIVPNLVQVLPVSVLAEEPEWMSVINTHLKSGRDMLACQEEMMANPKLRKFAKL